MAEDDLIEALKALAHPLRFRILAALAAGITLVRDLATWCAHGHVDA
jgi:hypothetical protein